MSTSDQFPLTKLPLELRLRIYHYALPSRVLQFGYNFPFPFLPGPTSDREAKRATTPTPTTLPVLFHIWHESRAFCLSKYIPFAYTYAHPTLDTLYFTRHACYVFASQLPHRYTCAQAPLYPITLLRRVAIEIAEEDLLSTQWQSSLFCDAFDRIKEPMRMFGYPKEILLVKDAADHRTSAVARGRVRGWDEVQIVENTPAGEGPLGALVEVVKRFLRKRQQRLDDWLAHGIPEVRCVGVVKRGNPTATSLAKVTQLEDLAVETAKNWFNAEAKGGRIYYDLWDTAKRLRRAGIKLPSEWGLDS